jgi:hypothetical protein
MVQYLQYKGASVNAVNLDRPWLNLISREDPWFLVVTPMVKTVNQACGSIELAVADPASMQL